MPLRLSTLFLIFVMVAASLALFGIWGLWGIVFILLAALLLNQSNHLGFGILYVSPIIFLGVICPGFFSLAMHANEGARSTACRNNLKQLGLALHNYHDANKHFPSTYKFDENGKYLFSWRVQILPMMEYGALYDSIKKDEPWNSWHNTNVLNQAIPEFLCPWSNFNENAYTTNYMAVIGPGTAWREDSPIKISDLPDGGSRTLIAVEVVNSGVNWAAPRDLTVNEALENMKTGKGLRISTAHPSRINVLFADGVVRFLPSKMPISLWRKILAGEMSEADLDNIEEKIDKSSPDMVDVSIYTGPGEWFIILSMIVWLLSVVLLLYRAIKSRPKPVAAT